MKKQLNLYQKKNNKTSRSNAVMREFGQVQFLTLLLLCEIAACQYSCFPTMREKPSLVPRAFFIFNFWVGQLDANKSTFVVQLKGFLKTIMEAFITVCQPERQPEDGKYLDSNFFCHKHEATSIYTGRGVGGAEMKSNIKISKPPTQRN